MLTQVAGAPVCPSDDVDQAWHLHITRTADYERFCREVLGHFLHHLPAGRGEGERHRGMYAQTLALYRRAFQAHAPEAVWPAVDRRFAPPPPAANAIALQGPLAVGPFLAAMGLGSAFALAIVLNRLGVLDATHALSGPRFLLFAVPATLVLMGLSWLSTAPLARPGPRDTLDLYEAAWLSGGAGRLTAAALGVLVERRLVALRTSDVGTGWRRHSTTRLVATDASRPADLHPIELACLVAARGGVLTFERAHVATRPWAMRVDRRLRAAGLAGEDAHIAPARAAMAAVLATWLAIEFERILHALSTPRPMGFLVILALVTAASFALLVLQLGRPTWRGRRMLRALGADLRSRRPLAASRAAKTDAAATIPPELLPMTLALAGPAAVLGQPMFAGLDLAIGPDGMRRANSSTAGADGCGSGDGGSGGGCGGGGCGGGGCGG